MIDIGFNLKFCVSSGHQRNEKLSHAAISATTMMDGYPPIHHLWGLLLNDQINCLEIKWYNCRFQHNAILNCNHA